MAPTKRGAPGGAADPTSVTTRNTTALPSDLATNDVITLEVMGGLNAWTHTVASPGVTWTQIDILSSVSGILSSMWRGFVVSGATALSQPITLTAVDSGLSAQSTKLNAVFQAWVGATVDTGGTAGANAINVYAKLVSATAADNVVTPNTPPTTVPNCVLWSVGGGAKGAVPVIASITYEGGTADIVEATIGTASLHGSAAAADLTPLTSGVAPGGKVFAFFDSTPAAMVVTPRVGWSLAIAPSPSPATVTAAIDQTDPQTGVLLTLTGTVTGAATSRLWRVVSGPSSPAIAGSTSNVGTVTPTVPGTYVFGFTATNASGTSPEQTVTTYVHPADGADVPAVSVSLPAAWSVYPSGTALANVSDTDPTTGIQNASGTPSHTDKAVITFAPMGPGSITFDLYSLYVTTGVTGRAIVYKPDGVTQVYPASGGNDWTPTTAEALHTVTLDATALAALSTVDRRALVVKISAQ